MNSLEIKKRAFMAAVTRNYGFVRVKSGSLPLTLESCIRTNLINYKISGNTGKNLFDKSKSPSGIASETEVRNVAGMALLNDEVRRIFKPSTTYTMIYDAEVTYVPNLDEYTLNPSGSANWIGFILYSGKTGYAANIAALAPVVEPVTQGIKYHVCKKFITPEKIDDTYGNYTMRFYTRTYNSNSGGAAQAGGVTFTNIQIIEGDYTGDNEPEYEPYKCVGDKTKNLFDMNLITNSKYETHPDENYFDVKAYSITAMSPSNFMIMSGLKAGDTVTTSRTKEVIQEGEGNSLGAWGKVTLLSKVSGVSSVVLCDMNENIGTVTIPDDFNPNNYYGLVIYGMNKTDSILRIHNMQIVKGSYTEETMPEYEPYGYKIPITVGNNTTNIFLNAPLGIGESIEYKSGGLPPIAVSDGTNIISIDTEVSPSAFEAKYYSNIKEE